VGESMVQESCPGNSTKAWNGYSQGRTDPKDGGCSIWGRSGHEEFLPVHRADPMTAGSPFMT